MSNPCQNSSAFDQALQCFAHQLCIQAEAVHEKSFKHRRRVFDTRRARNTLPFPQCHSLCLVHCPFRVFWLAMTRVLFSLRRYNPKRVLPPKSLQIISGELHFCYLLSWALKKRLRQKSLLPASEFRRSFAHLALNRQGSHFVLLEKGHCQSD